MKNKINLFNYAILGIVFLIGTPAISVGNEKHRPDVLDTILESIGEVSEKGHQPVVIFDLDDTLLNARSRTYRILKAFAYSEDIRTRFPAEAKIAANIKLKDHSYYLQNTLKRSAITNEAFLKEADSFWLKRFFSNEYCAEDEPIRGAAKYVREVHHQGAVVVYLTGRDAPRMESCTVESLARRGFPMGDGVQLMMKPNKEKDDLLFKKEAFAKIRTLGALVAGFENEPINVNAFADEWPEGQMVFLDTDHSNKPDVPKPHIPWVRDFIH